MRVVIQRVTSASVTVEGSVVGAIGRGLLVLVGIGHGDDEATVLRLATKTAELRIFPDAADRFEVSLLDAGHEALVVSQFTLYGDMRNGRRPSWNGAARPETAAPLVETYASALEALGVRVARGVFGAYMQVESVNDGPVTLILDSENLERSRRG
jgi:D-tyrosyl-tRNA(Tyr) deacylase